MKLIQDIPIQDGEYNLLIIDPNGQTILHKLISPDKFKGYVNQRIDLVKLDMILDFKDN